VTTSALLSCCVHSQVRVARLELPQPGLGVLSRFVCRNIDYNRITVHFKLVPLESRALVDVPYRLRKDGACLPGSPVFELQPDHCNHEVLLEVVQGTQVLARYGPSLAASMDTQASRGTKLCLAYGIAAGSACRQQSRHKAVVLRALLPAGARLPAGGCGRWAWSTCQAMKKVDTEGTITTTMTAGQRQAVQQGPRAASATGSKAAQTHSWAKAQGCG
jgi:hypothetical protein